MQEFGVLDLLHGTAIGFISGISAALLIGYCVGLLPDSWSDERL